MHGEPRAHSKHCGLFVLGFSLVSWKGGIAKRMRPKFRLVNPVPFPVCLRFHQQKPWPGPGQGPLSSWFTSPAETLTSDSARICGSGSLCAPPPPPASEPPVTFLSRCT